jgi:hypothetical protein
VIDHCCAALHLIQVCKMRIAWYWWRKALFGI